MLNRLESDRSLAAFAGQFVPLKIVTDGNPQWGQWATKYPIDGAGIPRLYVVRADGEKLYGAVGSLPGDQLPQMMLITLKQAGRAFSDADALLLEQAVSTAQAALDSGDLLTAAVTLSGVAAFGSPDELGSFARPALLAAELYAKLQTEIDAKVAKAQEELAGSENAAPLESLLAICESEAAYKLFPKLKSKATSLTRDIKRNNAYAEPLAQAEGLVKARGLRSAANPRIRGRATAAYTAVIRSFPGSKADELARAELAAIDPDAKILQTAASEMAVSSGSGSDEKTAETSTPDFREWTARSGNFKTSAKYVQQKAGKVQLIKEDGKTIVVDISLLSDKDQAYLREQ